MFTWKEIIFTIIIASFASGVGVWQAKKEVKAGIQQFEQQEKELMDADTKKMQESVNIKEHFSHFTTDDLQKRPEITTMRIVPHFSAEDIKKILDACRRNNLKGELYTYVFAIRKVENGGKGREFGIIHPKCERLMAADPEHTFEIQAGWAAATVQKNYDRWIEAGKPNDYITYLGNIYCPVGAANDPNGLNKNWIPNINSWVKKISS